MAVLRCHFFYTPEAEKSFAASSKRQVEKGTNFLRGKGHNIQIESYPLGGGGTRIAGLGGLINPYINNGGLAQYLKLRQQCHAAMPDPNPPRVPVIFLSFSTTEDAGQTVQVSSAHTWPPFILIDVDQANQDGLTVLHEMGHCVGLRHPGDIPVVQGVQTLDEFEDQNFMAYGPPVFGTNGAIPGKFHPRINCFDWQIWRLRLAYFYGA